MLKRLPSNQMVVGSNLAAGKAFLAIYLMIEAKNRKIQTCCNSVSRINFEGKTYSNPILETLLLGPNSEGPKNAIILMDQFSKIAISGNPVEKI